MKTNREPSAPSILWTVLSTLIWFIGFMACQPFLIIFAFVRGLARPLDMRSIEVRQSNAMKWLSGLLPAYPRLWQLLGFLFPPRFREHVYSPSIADDTVDFLAAMKKYRGRRARYWLRLCFGIRTIIRLVQCVGVLSQDRLAKTIFALVPRVIRRLFSARTS